MSSENRIRRLGLDWVPPEHLAAALQMQLDMGLARTPEQAKANDEKLRAEIRDKEASVGGQKVTSIEIQLAGEEIAIFSLTAASALFRILHTPSML